MTKRLPGDAEVEFIAINSNIKPEGVFMLD